MSLLCIIFQTWLHANTYAWRANNVLVYRYIKTYTSACTHNMLRICTQTPTICFGPVARGLTTCCARPTVGMWRWRWPGDSRQNARARIRVVSQSSAGQHRSARARRSHMLAYADQYKNGLATRVSTVCSPTAFLARVAGDPYVETHVARLLHAMLTCGCKCRPIQLSWPLEFPQLSPPQPF